MESHQYADGFFLFIIRLKYYRLDKKIPVKISF